MGISTSVEVTEVDVEYFKQSYDLKNSWKVAKSLVISTSCLQTLPTSVPTCEYELERVR